MAAEDTGWQRLDKFLFHARLCKTREIAASLAEGGGVRINRQPTDKPHAKLRPGDILTLSLPRGVVVAEVLSFFPRRVSASQAQTLYREIPAS
ncbi:MAG: heat-shock protein [Acidocella sp. 20-63-7]|nr:MAG: heat-shock protein [Acidocella sp. 20-63-7]HQT45587.1 RNA-binding S4 domain-containing protein [Acidocella sp.]